MIKKRNILNVDEYIQNMNTLEAIQKGLYANDEICQSYFEIEALYRYFLELTLANNSDIIYCENEFQEANIGTISQMNKDEYQVTSNFKYFYVRNDLYIENLTTEEINWLISRYRSKSLKYDKNIKKFILASLERVIKKQNIDKDALVFYGPFDIRFAALQNQLVLGIRFELFEDDNSKNDEEVYNNFISKRATIAMMLEGLDDEIAKEMGLPAKIIEYNESSIKKNNKVI